MQLRIILYLFVIIGLIPTLFLSCSEESSTEPESPAFNASGTWALIFTQTKIVSGDYIECGTRPVPQRSFEIMQNGKIVTLMDKNGELVNGSVTGASYEFNFKELKDINDKDYIYFNLKLQLSSDTSCTGTYRMDERTFFTVDSFFCITEGTLVGSCPYDPTKYIERGTVRDIDGNNYQTVKIGAQWWMAENLKVTRYRNGEVIPHVTDNSTWRGLSTAAYCSFDNADSNIATYGLLYNWYAVSDSRNIAPAGWHIPTDDEWKELEMYLGMSQSQVDATG